jgi:hypothetical protein
MTEQQHNNPEPADPDKSSPTLPSEFSLNSSAEAQQFEDCIREWMRKRCQLGLIHFPLAKAYERLHARADGGRVFAALLDLQMTFALAYCDSHQVGATWNEYFSKGRMTGGSIFDSAVKFGAKMDIHRYQTSYVLRARASWDKVMGFLILWYLPSQYDRYASSQSRKRTFKRIVSTIPHLIAPALVDQIDRYILELDSTFRTAEAHGTGVLRKWTLSMQTLAHNPQLKLIGHGNLMVLIMDAIAKLIDPGLADSRGH